MSDSAEPTVRRELKFHVFEAGPTGMFALGRQEKQTMKDACREAAAWINSQPGIEVLQIATSHSRFSAIVTVWYY